MLPDFLSCPISRFLYLLLLCSLFENIINPCRGIGDPEDLGGGKGTLGTVVEEGGPGDQGGGRGFWGPGWRAGRPVPSSASSALFLPHLASLECAAHCSHLRGADGFLHLFLPRRNLPLNPGPQPFSCARQAWEWGREGKTRWRGRGLCLPGDPSPSNSISSKC